LSIDLREADGCSFLASPECGLSMDKDNNAEINILRLDMQSFCRSDRSPTLQDGERSISTESNYTNSMDTFIRNKRL
jgi:hypothetical protein